MAEPAKAEGEAEKPPPGTVALEEDDDFEEFENDEWDEAEEEQADVDQWENDWDDDDLTDDFSKQLRAELEKHGKA
eukprot:CAMPEP_0119118320 /NCGR_PEP_ID=MMETSP1310-20130426/219_1 /TAXON_ID=464262 /ORGANISM="Genus nov. species nov., Strain RCC2339" /LENGTH=75 /DNA_ID=CAMNT_0007107667 /DNA_START=14 /DNA_END=241 /DNA_ORIENTATION=-